MICCNTGARTRRLMMTRARFRAYSVHRVLDEFLGIWRVEELVDNRNSLNISRSSSDFRSWRTSSDPPLYVGDLDGNEEETSSKYYCTCEKYFLWVSSYPYALLRTRPHVVAFACNTKRANSLTSSHDESSGYTSRLKNELQSCMRGGEIWFLWRRKDIQWSISFFLSLAHASVHVWWDDELFQFDFHAHWRVSIFASYHLIHYYYNVNCEY